MNDVEIRFDREKLEGIVPVGTYLADAAKRLGVRFGSDCDQESGEHFCSVTVISGSDLLSPLTATENTYFSAHGNTGKQRLADQAKIIKAGEIVVMTTEKKTEKATESEVDDKNEKYKKDFADMPLEKKIASLVQLEAIALGETFSFILNSPYMIFDKAMDVMAEFGLRKEDAARRSTRPEEHAPETPAGQEKAKAPGGRKRAHKEEHAE
jgi:ferredoxin